MRLYIILMLLSIHTALFAQAEVVEDTPVPTAQVDENLLEKFCSYLKGEYNSSAQNSRDTSYFNISLIIFPIWEKENDAKYFYVEQAMVGKEDKPYRQRIYKIYQTSATTVVSAIYTIKNQEEFIKLQESSKKQKNLSKEDIEYKEGCDVFLEYNGTSFKGGTEGKKCLSSLRNAKYTITEVEVWEDKMVSWDRGYTDNGVHAWGATAGGYIFDKIK